MLGRRRGRHHRHAVHDHLAPWHLGAVAGHDRHYRHTRVGQDLGGLVGLERHRLQGVGEGVAAMPQPPGGVELEPASILLGVDHEHPTGADHQVDALIACKGPAGSCPVALA
jgi:hypothetical protein